MGTPVPSSIPAKSGRVIFLAARQRALLLHSPVQPLLAMPLLAMPQLFMPLAVAAPARRAAAPASLSPSSASARPHVKQGRPRGSACAEHAER